MRDPVIAGELHHAALLGEIAAQDRDPAVRAQRGIRIAEHLLPRRCHGCSTDLGERPAVDRASLVVQEPQLHEALHEHAEATSRVEVGRDEPASGSQVGEDRGARADRVDVIDVNGHGRLGCNRQQMQHRVGRPPRGREGRDRVLERRTGHDRAGAGSLFHELDRETPGRLGDRGLVGMGRGDRVGAGRGQPQELERHAHRVGGELAPAGSRTRAGVLLHGAELARVDPPRVVRPHGLEDILDGEVAIVEPPRLDGAAVEDEPGDVHPAERHGSRGDGLVTADDEDEAVEAVAARDQLDGVGNELARDQ